MTKGCFISGCHSYYLASKKKWVFSRRSCSGTTYVKWENIVVGACFEILNVIQVIKCFPCVPKWLNIATSACRMRYEPVWYIWLRQTLKFTSGRWKSTETRNVFSMQTEYSSEAQCCLVYINKPTLFLYSVTYPRQGNGTSSNKFYYSTSAIRPDKQRCYSEKSQTWSTKKSKLATVLNDCL